MHYHTTDLTTQLHTSCIHYKDIAIDGRMNRIQTFFSFSLFALLEDKNSI